MNNKHTLKKIESRQNSLFKKILRLSNNRKRKQSELVWIEQKRHLERYIQTYLQENSSEKIEAVLVAQSLFEDPSSRQWLEETVKCHVLEFAVIKDSLLGELTFCSTSKLVALAPWRPKKLNELLVKEVGTYLILDDIEKPGNVGAILRSCDGAGVDAVIVIGKESPSGALITHCDLGHPSVVQNAMGALFSLQVAAASFEEVCQWLAREKITLYLGCPEATTSFDEDYDPRACLLVGREDVGVSACWKEVHAAQSRSIPMRGICDSLNVATSAALMLYAMQSARFKR